VSGWARVVQIVYLGFGLLLFGGLFLVLFALRLATFLMLAGAIGMFGTRLVVGVIEYRRTMRRPWPRVPPIEEDDDEW
jgi:hypothetical protein